LRGDRLPIDHGKNSETYNIGGGNELENRDITFKILELLGKPDTLIKRVADRQGHDRRYSLDASKLEKVGFEPSMDFESGLRKTVDWYRTNEAWWRAIKERSAEFKAYYEKQYSNR
jgi:dTDP-glucose 4,6-dehydratase